MGVGEGRGGAATSSEGWGLGSVVWGDWGAGGRLADVHAGVGV